MSQSIITIFINILYLLYQSIFHNLFFILNEDISSIIEMSDLGFDDDLVHDRDAEEDIYAALYPTDVVSFLYDGKVLSGIVETIFHVNEKVDRLAIKSLDKKQHGSVNIFNVRGGSENNVIESLFVMEELMPQRSRSLDDIHEKMFVSFSGS